MSSTWKVKDQEDRELDQTESFVLTFVWPRSVCTMDPTVNGYSGQRLVLG